MTMKTGGVSETLVHLKLATRRHIRLIHLLRINAMFSVCRRRHLGWCVSPRSDPNTSPRPHFQLLATNPVISTFRVSAAEIARAAGKPRSSIAILLFNVNNACRCDDYKQHRRIDSALAPTRQFDVHISAGASRWRPDDRCR